MQGRATTLFRRVWVPAFAGTTVLFGTVCFGLAMIMTGLGSGPAQAADPTPEQIDQGREIYGENCETCHGRDMAAPGAVVFDLRKFPKDDHDRFKNSVLNGKGTAMPAWAGKVSDEDLANLWAYVKSGG